MTTVLSLSNGTSLVNIDDKLQITDLYFPHIGQENQLALYANQFYFRINGRFFYINHRDWEIKSKYKENSLIANSTLVHKESKLEVNFVDCVLDSSNTFIRQFTITNPSKNNLEVLLYFQNNFSIYENDIGDTITWYYPAQCLVHYKKDRYIAIGSSNHIHQFTCAARSDNNGRGASPDPQTGDLFFNAISTGSVNSCISYKFDLPPKTVTNSDMFITLGQNYQEIEKQVATLRKESINSQVYETEQSWNKWLKYGKSQEIDVFDDDTNKKINELYKKSLLIIRSQTDNEGAIIAANDGHFVKKGGKDTYSYLWPRDGAYVALAYIESGFKYEAQNYFQYLEKIISSEGYFLHKFYPSYTHRGSALASSWHPWIDNFGNPQLPIQLDQMALNIIAISKFYQKFDDFDLLKIHWNKLVLPMARFLVSYRYIDEILNQDFQNFVSGFEEHLDLNSLDNEFCKTGLPRPSYDIWEEYRGISSYTNSTIYAAFRETSYLSQIYGNQNYFDLFNKVADEIKENTEKFLFDPKDNRFFRMIYANRYSNTLIYDKKFDTSLCGLWAFGMFDVKDKRISDTMDMMIEKLTIPTYIGGIARKEEDFYNRIDLKLTGNPWFISTLWIAQYYIQLGNLEEAKKYIVWVLDHADDTGLIAEQADPYSGHGISVKPLTWSHAEFIRTINMLN